MPLAHFELTKKSYLNLGTKIWQMVPIGTVPFHMDRCGHATLLYIIGSYSGGKKKCHIQQNLNFKYFDKYNVELCQFYNFDMLDGLGICFHILHKVVVLLVSSCEFE